MCGNNMSAPMPAVVPAARKATAAVSGGDPTWGTSETQAAARGCVRAAPRALRGRAGNRGGRGAGCLTCTLTPTPEANSEVQC